MRERKKIQMDDFLKKKEAASRLKAGVINGLPVI